MFAFNLMTVMGDQWRIQTFPDTDANCDFNDNVRPCRITRHGAIKENTFSIMRMGKDSPPQANFFLEVDG